MSHRGGLPSFVRVMQHNAAAAEPHIPDYRGNNFFNTLGNLAVNPRSGLLCIDFESRLPAASMRDTHATARVAPRR